jgi:hypothetical protein
MKLRKLVTGAVIAQGLALLVGSPGANADVMYTYTGNDFNTFSGSPNPYTSNDKVTAALTFASPLPANLSEQNETPSMFTLKDGVNTITAATESSSISPDWIFTTDSNGDITQWAIVVYDTTGDNIQTNNRPAIASVLTKGMMQ